MQALQIVLRCQPGTYPAAAAVVPNCGWALTYSVSANGTVEVPGIVVSCCTADGKTPANLDNIKAALKLSYREKKVAPGSLPQAESSDHSLEPVAAEDHEDAEMQDAEPEWQPVTGLSCPGKAVNKQGLAALSTEHKRVAKTVPEAPFYMVFDSFQLPQATAGFYQCQSVSVDGRGQC